MSGWSSHASRIQMRGVGTTPRPRLVNMREYWQSHWNMGTREGLDCAKMRRVGPLGDGGKVLCFDAVPGPSEPCFVLSVGVGGLVGGLGEQGVFFQIYVCLSLCSKLGVLGGGLGWPRWAMRLPPPPPTHSLLSGL